MVTDLQADAHSRILHSERIKRAELKEGVRRLVTGLLGVGVFHTPSHT